MAGDRLRLLQDERERVGHELQERQGPVVRQTPELTGSVRITLGGEMTIDEAVEKQLGRMAFQLILLDTELTNVKAKIAELEAKISKDSDPKPEPGD